MYTNHRHYILLIFALGAITVTIFGYSFLRNKILAQAIHTSQITKQVTLVDEKTRREQNIASIYAKSTDERTTLNSFIVPVDQAVNLIGEIEKIGTDVAVPLDLSAIENEDVTVPKDSKLGHFKAHVEGSGSWSNVMRALTLLENMPYNISLENVRLTRLGDSAPDEALAVPESGSSTPQVKKVVAKASQWRLSLDLKILTTK